MDLQRELIHIMVFLGDIKGATRQVKEYRLDPDAFPELIKRASFNAVNYFVSRTYRAPSHPDFLPLYKVEDLLSGDELLLGCMLIMLIKRWQNHNHANPNNPFVHKILGIVQRHSLTDYI